jgi:hypothetical protein
MCTLKHPFDAATINGLVMKIARSKQAPVPSRYSNKLRALIDTLLQKDPAKRPTVNQMLLLDFINERIDNFLPARCKRNEFSHTVFHGLPALAEPDDLALVAEEQPPPGRASARSGTFPKAPLRGKTPGGPKSSTGKAVAAPAAKPPAAAGKPPAAAAKPPAAAAKPPAAAARPPPGKPAAAAPAKKAAARGATPKEPTRTAAAPPPAKRETLEQVKKRLQQEQKDATTRPGQVQIRSDGSAVMAMISAKKSGPDVIQMGQVMVDMSDGKGQSTDDALQSLGLGHGLEFDDGNDGDVDEFQAFRAVASGHLEAGGGDDDDDEDGTEKFFFKGKEVPLKATDPAGRLAEIRAFIEKGIGGKDKFAQACQLVANGPQDLTEEQLNAMFKAFLKTDAEMEFLGLIRQYVVIEIFRKGE